MSLEAKFREDKNLAFLQDADWQDLKILANALIKDHSGTEQWTGELKSTLVESLSMHSESEELAYKSIWKAIAAEIQLYGGDTLVNLARRKGVEYEEILHDVAKKIKVDFHKETTAIDELEDRVLRKLFKRVTTLDELPQIYRTLEREGLLGLTSLTSDPWNTVKKGVGLGGNTTAAAGASAIFAGLRILPQLAKVNPLVSAATLPLTLKDFSSPAYRVTIPAVCIIAMMRRKHDSNLYKDEF